MNTRTSKRAGEEITPAQFEEAMARYYAAGLRGLEINKAIETEINEVLEKYEAELQRTSENKTTAFESVQQYCTVNKNSLFAKRRSIGTQWGIAGFRLGTPRLKTAKGNDWSSILAQLKIRLPGYVRTNEEPAKDLLLADRNKEEVAPVLMEIGIRVVQDELFYIETKKAA